VDSFVIANIYSAEGTLAGVAVNVVFPWRPRKIVVTNDSSVNTYTVVIKGSTLTLKPTETLTAVIILGDLTLNGTGAYRVWGFG